MPPFYAQALVQAFTDAGLGALSDAEKMAVLRPSHPAGAAIAAAVRAAPSPPDSPKRTCPRSPTRPTRPATRRTS